MLENFEPADDSRSTRPDASIAEAFQTTLDLFELGLEIVRQNLRRAHPEATDQEIDRRLKQWLHERPGDCGGPIVDVSSRRA